MAVASGHARRISGGGLTLVEVAFAIGILGVCLIAIYGLLPKGLELVRRGGDETRAGHIAAKIFASSRVNGSTRIDGVQLPNIPQSAGFATEVYADDIGTLSGGKTPESRYKVNVVLQPAPGGEAAVSVLTVRVTGLFDDGFDRRYSAFVQSAGGGPQ